MLNFKQETFYSRLLLPNGKPAKRPVEIRTHPITGRTCRITYIRSEENEPGTEKLPAPPPFVSQKEQCPFCAASLEDSTPKLPSDLYHGGSMRRGASVLFPNLFPYGRYSAVSLFDEGHFVEIGTASPASYADSFMNCRDYLLLLLNLDPEAVHMAITQNHLPSAGGSLLHPHLQVQADRIASNNQRFLMRRASDYYYQTGNLIFQTTCVMKKRPKTGISEQSVTGNGWRLLLRKVSSKYGEFSPGSHLCDRPRKITGRPLPKAF